VRITRCRWVANDGRLIKEAEQADRTLIEHLTNDEEAEQLLDDGPIEMLAKERRDFHDVYRGDVARAN
jgi:hypothetical protein